MFNAISSTCINEVFVPNARHICILIPGTTDPVNMINNIQIDPDTNKTLSTANAKGRANSYKSSSFYWDNDFYDAIEKLEKEDVNFTIFDKFGWSGDNCIANREISGKYLVRRLCMPDKHNKEGYYYPIRNENVYFHLIGHSHGGNVINEMTKEMHLLPNWPEKWKIKSITYLSVPFFKKIHQIKVTDNIFHKDAEILNVHNDYDLTQNFLADFSMFDLSIIENILEKKKVISKKNKEGKIIKMGLIDECIKAYSQIPIDKLSDIWLSKEEGEEFYTKTREFLIVLKSVFTGEIDNEKKQKTEYGLFEVIKELNKDVEFRVSDFLKEAIPKNKLKTKRKILNNPSYEELKNILEKLLENILALESIFLDKIEDVNKNITSYSRIGIINDLIDSKLLETISDILDVNEDSLISNSSNSLWNLLFKILIHNVEHFDNTYVFPDIQFKGSILEKKLTNIDVSKKDEYDKHTAQKEPFLDVRHSYLAEPRVRQVNPKVFSERYYKLLKDLKEKEKKYEENQNQTNLMDMLFTLVSQTKIYNLLNSWVNPTIFVLKVILNKEAAEKIDRFKIAINKIMSILNKSHVGNLEISNMGELIYFLEESHSTSRRYLHEEVKEFINKMKKEEKC